MKEAGETPAHSNILKNTQTLDTTEFMWWRTRTKHNTPQQKVQLKNEENTCNAMKHDEPTRISPPKMHKHYIKVKKQSIIDTAQFIGVQRQICNAIVWTLLVK